jgi:hypothetical protein
MASVLGDGIDIQGAAASGISAIGQNDGGYFNGRVAGSSFAGIASRPLWKSCSNGRLGEHS